MIKKKTQNNFFSQFGSLPKKVAMLVILGALAIVAPKEVEARTQAPPPVTRQELQNPSNVNASRSAPATQSRVEQARWYGVYLNYTSNRDLTRMHREYEMVRASLVEEYYSYASDLETSLMYQNAINRANLELLKIQLRMANLQIDMAHWEGDMRNALMYDSICNAIIDRIEELENHISDMDRFIDLHRGNGPSGLLARAELVRAQQGHVV